MSSTTTTTTTSTASLTDPSYLQAKHEAGLAYADYVATGKPAQQEGWQKIHDQLTLTEKQQKLLGDFCRDIKVIGVSGIWCGDCVRQGAHDPEDRRGLRRFRGRQGRPAVGRP